MNHEILKRVIYDQHEVIRNTVIVERDIVLEEGANYVLVGLRRAGKTTLLYKRVQNLIQAGVSWDQIVYVNFDDERLIGFQTTDFEDILLTAEEMSSGKHYYYFDEIQSIQGWEKFAIRLANQGYKVDITGSNAIMLSKEVAAKLGGRYITKEILPYSFKEYLTANQAGGESHSIQSRGRQNALLETYFVYGGMPASVGFLNKQEYLSSIYQKVLYGDIITHNRIRNENGVRLLIKKIAETIGQNISFTKLQNIITGIGYKISKDIVIDYCGYAKDSFLLFTLGNYYASFLDRESNPKYYFRDNGILNLFLVDRRSALLENLIAVHLYRKNAESLFYLQGSKVDIDFYAPNQKLLVQAAYSLQNPETKSREIENLIAFEQSSSEKHRLLIVTFEEEDLIEKDGFRIEVIPLRRFLLEF